VPGPVPAGPPPPQPPLRAPVPQPALHAPATPQSATPAWHPPARHPRPGTSSPPPPARWSGVGRGARNGGSERRWASWAVG